ncbi:hypothetical protein ElyMa_003091900 [Elysia marginata]|uniref:Uncharacterized protein n=1 Tax=Elysia marginata TaxID=1093978 RepID=A0AAV4IPN9_9GAST|nr:hypothetical protein ElyMa_003091900 [Elysia marginata]
MSPKAANKTYLSSKGDSLELSWTWGSLVPRLHRLGFTLWIVEVDPGFVSSQNALQKCFSFCIVMLEETHVFSLRFYLYSLETVWTGMHHRRGVLLWDELKPTMVTPYFGYVLDLVETHHGHTIIYYVLDLVEKYVESIGESPQASDLPATKGKEKSFQLDTGHLQITTQSTTTTTDQSNLEDDDYHVVTKRDATSPATPVPLSKLLNERAAMATANPPTAAPKFSQQDSVKGTSLPASTNSQMETTRSPPEAPKRVVDDLLNRLFQASFVGAASDQRSPLASRAASDQRSPLASQVNAPPNAASPGRTEPVPDALVHIQGKSDTHARASEELAQILAASVSKASTTAKPSHSHDHLIALDMLAPKSKVVLPSESSISISSSNQNSSDISIPFSDSNEFLSTERKKSNENVFAFSQSLLNVNDVINSPSTTSTTEGLDDSHEVTESFSSVESSTLTPQTNKTEKQSKEYSSREMVDLWGPENKTNTLDKHSDPNLSVKSNQELTLDTLGVDSAEIFDTASSLNSSSEEIFDESNVTSAQNLEELLSMSESQRQASKSSLVNDAIEESGATRDQQSSDIDSDLPGLLMDGSPSLLEHANSMEFEDCHEEHASVCVTEAIEKLALGEEYNIGVCNAFFFLLCNIRLEVLHKAAQT